MISSPEVSRVDAREITVDPLPKLLPPYPSFSATETDLHNVVLYQSFFERSELYRGTEIDITATV